MEFIFFSQFSQRMKCANNNKKMDFQVFIDSSKYSEYGCDILPIKTALSMEQIHDRLSIDPLKAIFTLVAKIYQFL